jgi:tetratricopeptide (TPR) repeat protein
VLVLLSQSIAAAAVRAPHALAAGKTKQALSLFKDAGDQAMRVFAVKDAIAAYEQAAELTGDGLDSLVGDLLLQLGRAYELENDLGEAREVYLDLIDRARGHDPGLECVGLNRLAMIAIHGSVGILHALRLLGQVEWIAEQTRDPALIGETAWNLAQVQFYAGEPRESIAQGEKALEIGRQRRDLDLVARSKSTIGYSKIMVGEWDDLDDLLADPLDYYRKTGNRVMEGDTLLLMAHARTRSGRPRDGLEAALAAREISLGIGNKWGLALSGYQAALPLVDLGRFSEALALLPESLAAAREVGFGFLLQGCHWAYGTVYRSLGAFDQAIAHHREFESQLDPSQIGYLGEACRGELCADYALAGDWKEAAKCAMVAGASRKHDQPMAGLYRYLEVEALLHANREKGVRYGVRQLMKKVAGTPRYRIAALRAQAVWDRHEGKLPAAIQALAEAAQGAAALGIPNEIWSIKADLARLYEDVDEMSSAAAARARAAAIVDDLAAGITDPVLRAGFLTWTGDVIAGG